MVDGFPAVVYVLCFLTSAACAWLLGRSYRKNGGGLLLWSSVCFVLLALNNLALVADFVIWPSPDIDLRLPRLVLALAACCSLLFGFIWKVGEE